MEVKSEQFEELMTLARANRTMLMTQDKKLDKLQNTLIGNGSSQSVVARLLIVEERQKEAAFERKTQSTEIVKLSTCMERIDKEGANESHRINNMEHKQDEMLAEIKIVGTKADAVTETVNNWKQRGIGFSLGMAGVAGGSFAAVLKLLEAVFQ